MPVPVISVAQMREWEKVTWASGIKEADVMRNAGRAVAHCIHRLTRPNDVVVFLAGKGHNGDDAAYGYEFLQDRRKELLRVIDPDSAMAELGSRLERKPALLVDGLFGIGLNRALSGAWQKLIERINASNCAVLAVDVPSGLSADTGQPLDVAVRATSTLTFGAVKSGLLKSNGAPFVGRLEVASEIGLAPYPFSTEVSLTSPEDFAHFPPRRSVASHKGTYGHLAIIAGSYGYHGAAVLAGRGAQRAQPGLITLLTDERTYVPVASQLQSVMVRSWTPDLHFPESCTAVLIGPGLAAPDVTEQLQRGVQRLWQNSPLPVIVDASALDWLPAGSCPEDAIRVITPHPGEAARMLQTTTPEIQGDRIHAIRELSRRWGRCFVLLKGHQSIVGRDKDDLFINNSGNPCLAQGGSGDLLAGYLSGLLAQPALQTEPLTTVRYAAWQHGASADQLHARKPNFTVEDMAGVLGDAAADHRAP